MLQVRGSFFTEAIRNSLKRRTPKSWRNFLVDVFCRLGLTVKYARELNSLLSVMMLRFQNVRTR